MVRGLVEALEDLSLADVPVEQVHLAQQGAVVRLHLFVLGDVHRLVAEMMESGVNQLRRLGDGPISGTAATAVQQTLLDDWEKFISKYTELIARGMWIGVGLPLGTLAILHSAYILPNLELNESQRQFTEQINSDVVFQPQLQAVIDAAYQRVYDDGLNLSQRIWQLDTYGRNGLNSAVSLAIGQGKSAWELAQSIEGFLGPGQDCPRWTRDRLNGLTKADIASGDRTGLHSGNECQAQGVSYNALRLARTEIQAVYNMATDRLFAAMPWVEMEQINLSPDHAVPDICDDAINDAENGDGVYPKGTIGLPLHPHCLCFKSAVLMEPGEFVGQLRDWLGGGSWPAMSQYEEMIGDIGEDLRGAGVGVSMAWWLWGSAVDLASIYWTLALA